MATTDEILLSETDGACAYCGIKDYRILTTHHIIQETLKDESYDNKIILCHNCHHLYHEGKGPSLEDLKDIKKRLIYKTLTQQGVNALKVAYRDDFVQSAPYLVNHLIELHLLKFIQPLVTYENNVVIEAVYGLTDRGKEFAEKWDLK